MTNHANAPTFPRNHQHCMDRTGVNYVPCTNLTHCPAICDCPVNACTAEQHETRMSLRFLMKMDPDDFTDLIADAEPPAAAPECDYVIKTIPGTSLVFGECLACGTQTNCSTDVNRITHQIVAHVEREWMQS